MTSDPYRQNVFEELLKALKANPGASENEIREQLWSTVKRSEKYVRLLYDNWFTNNFKLVNVDFSAHRTVVTKRKRAKIQRARVVQKLVSIALLEVPMPNGLDSGDCRFSYLAKVGGFWSTVAKHGKPNEVLRKKLSEQQLQNIWGRNR